MHAGAFDGGFIHAALIVVANLLLGRGSIGVIGGVFFQNVAHNEFAAFLKDVETSPTGAVARNWILRFPLGAGIGVEVGAGVDAFVQHVGAEANRAARAARRGGGLGLAQSSCQEQQNGDFNEAHGSSHTKNLFKKTEKPATDLTDSDSAYAVPTVGVPKSYNKIQACGVMCLCVAGAQIRCRMRVVLCGKRVPVNYFFEG